MTGFFVAIGDCFACGRRFSFNPDLVTCPIVDGEPRPCCRGCIEAANADPRRKAAGLPPFPILPGAYEPAEGP